MGGWEPRTGLPVCFDTLPDTGSSSVSHLQVTSGSQLLVNDNDQEQRAELTDKDTHAQSLWN